MNRLQVISDKNKKSLNIKNILLKKISANNFQNKNLIIVIGGDSFISKLSKETKIQINFFTGSTLETMVFS